MVEPQNDYFFECVQKFGHIVERLTSCFRPIFECNPKSPARLICMTSLRKLILSFDKVRSMYEERGALVSDCGLVENIWEFVNVTKRQLYNDSWVNCDVLEEILKPPREYFQGIEIWASASCPMLTESIANYLQKQQSTVEHITAMENGTHVGAASKNGKCYDTPQPQQAKESWKGTAAEMSYQPPPRQPHYFIPPSRLGSFMSEEEGGRRSAQPEHFWSGVHNPNFNTSSTALASSSQIAQHQTQLVNYIGTAEFSSEPGSSKRQKVAPSLEESMAADTHISSLVLPGHNKPLPSWAYNGRLTGRQSLTKSGGKKRNRPIPKKNKKKDDGRTESTAHELSSTPSPRDDTTLKTATASALAPKAAKPNVFSPAPTLDPLSAARALRLKYYPHPPPPQKKKITIPSTAAVRYTHPLLELPKNFVAAASGRSTNGRHPSNAAEVWPISDVYFPRADTYPISYLARILGFEVSLGDGCNVQMGRIQSESESPRVPAALAHSDVSSNRLPMNFADIVLRQEKDEINTTKTNGIDAFDPTWCDIMHHYRGFDSDFFAESCESAHREVSKDCLSLATERGICTETIFRFANLGDEGVLATLLRTNAYYHTVEEYKKALIENKNDFFILSLNKNGEPTGAIHYQFWWYHVGRQKIKTARQQGGPTDEHDVSTGPLVSEHIVTICSVEAVKNKTHKDNTRATGQLGVTLGQSEYRTGVVLTALALENARQNNVWYTVFQCDEPNGEKAQKFFKRFYRMSPVIRRARGKKAPAYLVVGDLGKSSFKYSIVCSKDDQVKLHGANRKNGSGNGMVRQRIIALLKMSPADVRSMPQPFKKGTDVSNTVVKITSDMSMYKDLSTENYDAPPKSGCNLDFQRIFSVSLPPSTPLSTELLDELKLKRNKLREREHTIASRAKLLIEKLVDERREYDAAEPERAHWTQILKEHKLMEKQRREASEAQKAQIEKDLDADCDVCGDGNVTCSNQILFCEACNIAVHQKCYGIDVIPAEDWFCKACVHYGRDKRIQRSQECGEPKPDLPPLEVSCLLCPKKDGAFVKAMDGKEFGFVHVVCAKWCGLNYVDKEKKDYVEDVSTTLAYHEKNTLSCDICDDKGGALFKCCHAGCKRYMHVTCARSSPTCTMKHGESSEGLIASENSWKVRCHLHANSESSFVSTDSAMVVANPSQADEKDNAKNATTVAVKADTANGTTFLTKDTKITVTPKIVEEAPKTTPKTDGRIKLKLKIKSPSKDKNKESNTVAKAPPTTSAPSAKDNSSSNFKVYPHPSSCAMTDTSVRKRTRKRKKLSEYSTDNDATVSNSKTAPFANDNFSSNLEVYPHPSSRAATDASVRKSTRKRKNIAESSSDNDAAVSNSKTVLTDFTTSAPDIMTVTEVSPKLPEIKKTDSQPSSCAATDISARKRTRKQKNILESSTENDATVSNNRIVLTGVTTSAPVIMTVTEVSLKLPEIRSQRRGKTRKSGKTSALDDNLGEEISVSDEEIYDVVKPSLKDKNAPVTGTETLSTPITITTTSSTKPKKNPKKEIYVSVEEIPDVVPPSIKDNNPSVTGIETLSTPRTRTTTSSTKPKKNLKRLFCDWKNRAQEEKNLERIISRSNWAEGAYCTLCDKQCDNINDLVSCRDCKYVAHRECIQLLGFNYTCKEARKETEKKVRGGLKVRDISCLKPIECNVCNYSSGLFVKAKATQVTKLKKKSGTDSFNFFGKELFIHANCAQLHQLLIDEDKCVECNKLICSDGRTHIRPKLSCSLCGEYSKPKISCNFKNGGKKCPQAFHASCAHNAGFDVFHSDPKEDCTSIYCFCHGRSQYSFRAKLEDLIEFERARLGEDYEKFGLNMGIKDQAVLYYASIRVLQQLAWAWKWVNWWIDDNQNWEPFLEEGQDESQMTSEELRIVESTVKSRKQDAEKCNLADFGAALRNRDYDLEEGDDEEAFDQALRAVLETPSLVGPLHKYEINFFALWLGRAYRSKSHFLYFGNDKIPVSRKSFNLYPNGSKRYELDGRLLPGKVVNEASSVNVTMQQHEDNIKNNIVSSPRSELGVDTVSILSEKKSVDIKKELVSPVVVQVQLKKKNRRGRPPKKKKVLKIT